MLSRKKSIYEEILLELGYKKYPLHNLIPALLRIKRFSSYKRQTVSNAIQKLKKEQLLRIGVDAITVSQKGKKYIEQKMSRLHLFESPFKKNAVKNLLILFDIPEDRKAEREWFRRQLREFGYEMVQKSAWLGPSPLPREFSDYLKAIGLEDSIKTFKLANK